MQIIFNSRTKQNTVLLYNIRPTAESVNQITEWVKEAFSIPETIGGLYWTDLQGRQHQLELRSQNLYAMLLVFQHMMCAQRIALDYDDNSAPDDFISHLFKIPIWWIKIIRLFGLFNKNNTYGAYYKAFNDIASKKVSKSVPKQSECLRDPNADRRI